MAAIVRASGRLDYQMTFRRVVSLPELLQTRLHGRGHGSACGTVFFPFQGGMFRAAGRKARKELRRQEAAELCRAVVVAEGMFAVGVAQGRGGREPMAGAGGGR